MRDELAKKCYEMIKNMYSDSYSEMIDLFFIYHHIVETIKIC